MKKVSASSNDTIVLRGGKPLKGEVVVRGAKNSISKIMVAALLTDETCVLNNVADIEDAAVRLGCEVIRVDLNDQFRLGGSRHYEEWVLRLLGITPGGPIPWNGSESFELDVAESPASMEVRLQAHVRAGYSSRIAAGYCWSWSKPKVDYLFPDVKIGAWERPWNNPKDTRVGDAPGRPFWATDPDGFDQVGCIYTAQGFEFDYVGVIWGQDLRYDPAQGEWVGDRSRSRQRPTKDELPRRAVRMTRIPFRLPLTATRPSIRLSSRTASWRCGCSRR